MNKIFYSTILLLGVLMSTISCNKKDDPKPSNSTNNNNNNNGGGGTSFNSSTDYYWQATIAGTTKTFVRGTDSYLNGAAESQTQGSSISNQYGSTFAKYSIGTGGMSVANDNINLNFNLNNNPSESDYNTFFVAGSKNFTTSEESLNGVYIVWQDPDGKYWTTYEGSQSGSEFKITKVSSVIENGMSFKAVEATFTCKFYNGSASKTVTNGKVRGLISVYEAF